MKTLLLLLLVVFVPLICVCQLINNYDTCRTQLYYQYITSPAKETHIEKARTVQDNGIISAGYSKQGGSQDAITIKQNTNGQVVWQKEYVNTAYDEQFTDWRELPNRQLLVGGIAKDRATLQSVFFMMLLTADGNIIWQKSYADLAASSNITNAKIYPDYYGEYFFAAETNSSIIYGMTSNTGIINWQRSLATNSGTKLIAAISDHSRLLIATNSLDSGYHVSNFYYINYYWLGNPKEIKYSTKLGGAHQNSHYIFHDFEQYSQYTYFSGIRSVNNAPYELIRVNINQGYLHEGLETILTPGVIIDSTSRSAINIYGDVVSFTSGRKDNRLNTVQLTGSENFPSFEIWSASYQLPDSIVLEGNIKTWDNGYIFFGSKELPGRKNRITQLKIDSSSISAACINRRKENFDLIRNPFPTDTAQYSYNNLHGLVDFNYTAFVTNNIIDTATLCREINCPQLPLSDSCLDSYQKLYKAYEPNSFSSSIQVINGRTFVSGVVQPMDYVDESSSSFIAEMNRNGQVVNQKKYVIGFGFSGYPSYLRMYKGQDSSLLLYGYTYTSDSIKRLSVFIAKIDTNLNVKWLKCISLNNSQFAINQREAEIKQGSDGSYFLLYSDVVFGGSSFIYLTKLDANGNLLWTKVYKPSDPGKSNFLKATKLEVAGGYVYIMCDNGYNSYLSSFILKVTENNGDLLWSKKYSNTIEKLNFSGMMYMYNSELLLGGTFWNNSTDNPQNILVKADTSGNILNAVYLQSMYRNIAQTQQFLHDGSGNIYMNSAIYGTPPYSNPCQINVIVNNNFDIITSKKRPSLYNNKGYALALGAGGQLYETGSYASSYNYYSLLYLIKFSPDGRVGSCPSDTMLLQKVAPPTITVTNIPCVKSDTFFTVRSPVYRVDQFFLATNKLVCASVPGCNSLVIKGSDSICDKTLQYTFRAIRNSGCAAPLQWLYDNTNIQVISETDSSITLSFLATGNLMLKARFTSNCTPYIDSFLIHIMGDRPVLELGADTSICPGASLVLHVKKGFKSYKWQDGSTDSIFTVKAVGLYYVTVIDSCNNFLTDSIHVKINGNGPILNLGADSNFCNTNSILLNAHKGFLSYKWQDGSIDSVFNATLPGLYYVTVSDACGNRITDTVKLYSYRKATSLNLGADTIFCNQISIRLNAGEGFKSYRWQDGSVDSFFMAKSIGLYYVQVLDSCGVAFTDSVRLIPDNSIIVFDIGPDTSVCKANSILLQVTPGLNNYTWWPLVNTIPQSPTAIKVFPNTNTLYHVSAIKQNGCLVTDSILVKVHIPLPINLGIDTSICAGDTIHLNAGSGLKDYTWSTGEHTASIGVYQAGLYYVSVIDTSNCTSRDSLSILRIIPLPVIQLPGDTSICSGDTLHIYPGSFSSYHWYNGALQPTQNISQPGKYWLTVTDNRGCSSSDTFNLIALYKNPAYFLPNRLQVCTGETYTLNGFQTYTWNTGESNSTITLTGLNKYWVQVTDNNRCTGSDTMQVIYSGSEKVTHVTAFSPNNDGVNETFKPIESDCIQAFYMEIFNRWGQLIYNTSNPAIGWDGTCNKQPAPSAVYYYIVHYKNLQGQGKMLSGSITLLR